MNSSVEMMEYSLFTYPNCARCDALKSCLSGKNLQAEEFDLSRKESKLKIREFLKVLKRDAQGGIIIPTLVVHDKEDVAAVCNSREEFENWLQSKG